MDSAATATRALALSLLAGFALAACDPPAPDEPLRIETEEVAPPIDAELSTEGDLKAAREAVRVTGVVPSDVPADLPLYVPSSVIDFGRASGGRAYVELDTGAPPATVQRWLVERLPGAGWKISAVGDALIQAERGSSRVEYRLSDLAPGTRIRLEYTPR